MRVVITHLKAPWPEGAKVGDVVDVGAEIPGWAVGKCLPSAGNAEPQPEPTKQEAAQRKGR